VNRPPRYTRIVEPAPPPSRLRKTLVITAEVALVVVILALLAANWIPILFGARQFRVGP